MASADRSLTDNDDTDTRADSWFARLAAAFDERAEIGIIVPLAAIVTLTSHTNTIPPTAGRFDQSFISGNRVIQLPDSRPSTHDGAGATGTFRSI